VEEYLIIGKYGQLSTYFCSLSKKKLKVFSSKDLDLRNTENIKNTLKLYSPKAIINFSSYNDVEGAESSIDNKLINSLALKQISEHSRDHQIPLIHISTDYVFNGEKGSYNEEDTTDPINSYGQAKLEGEDYIRSICSEYMIIRTSWLYSCIEGRNSFLNKALEIYLSQKDKVSGATDSIGSPTSAYSLATVLIKIIPLFLEEKNLTGTYHFSNKGRVSRYDFFNKILFYLDKKFDIPPPSLQKVMNSSFDMKARRPEDTSLDCQKIYDTFSIKPTDWEYELLQEINKISK